MKKLSLLLIFISLFCKLWSCPYTISLYDTYGDGWNGNTVTVTVNGSVVLTGCTVASGNGPTTYSFNANTGQSIQIAYNATGSWTSENEITVYNMNGTVIGQSGQGGVVPSTIDLTANCPAPTCTDGYMNGNETYIDCGGPDCPPCPQCGNGIQDADEEGVDCGGANCPDCVYEWNIDDVSNQTINTCNGLLYDSGGPNAGYQNSENYHVTFCSSNGNPLVLNITFNMESGFEDLNIYNGANTSAPLVYNLTATGTQLVVTGSTCLTIEFTSDGSVNSYEGFSIAVDCNMNYDPCDAWALPTSQNCSFSTMTTIGADDSPVADPPCGNYAGGDVWFEVTVPGTGIIAVNTGIGSLTNIGMALYSGTCNNLSLIGCYPDGPSSPNMPWAGVENLIPGQTVWIRVWDENDDQEGTFDICVIDNLGPPGCAPGVPLAADGCNNATPICTFNGYCGNTSSSYTPQNVPAGFCGSVENNSWLSFVAAEPQVTLNVWTSNCTTDYGIQMEIYQTYDCINFTSISNCSSEGVASDFAITTNVPLTIGETYILMIDGWGGDNCDYVIQATEGVAVATAISLDTGTDQVGICTGGSTQLQASGGTSYVWSPATGLDDPFSATPLATPLTTTTYTVSVTGGNPDCPASATASLTVYVTEGFSILATSSDVTCFGSSDGNASVIATNGVEPYSYLWSDVSPNDSINDSVSGLFPGDYIITVSDTTGCVLDTTVTVGEPSQITLDFSYTEGITGLDNCEANVDAVNNAVGSMTYLWDAVTNNQTTQTASGLIDGNYCVTVTDANGCTGTGCVDVFSIANPEAGFTFNGNQCFSGHSFDFNNTGTPAGTGITYLWNFAGGNPATSTDENPTGVTWANPGTYAVTQTVSQGSVSADTVINIFIFEQTDISVTGTDPLCFESYDGTASVVIISGTSPFVFAWSSNSAGQTSQVITGLGDGTYFVTVTDANGCTAIGSVKLFQPTELQGTTSMLDAHCNNSDGEAQIVVIGGTPNYSYQWSAGIGAATNHITGLIPGFYDVIVTDSNGCILNETVNVGNTADVVTNITASTDASCFGYCNGTITAVISANAVANYTIVWSDNYSSASSLNSNIRSGLCAGYYRVTITDFNNCSSADSISIHEPAVLQSTISALNVSCYGGSDGYVNLEVTGGTPAYSYLWTPGSANTQDISNLSTNTYSVVITDVNGCTALNSILVSQPNAPIVLSITPTGASCYGVNDGSANLTVTGGTPNTVGASYTYYWTGNYFTQDLSGVVAGIYNVTVTDANGCVATSSTIITQPNPIIHSTVAQNASCFGMSDGVATVSVVSGGTPSYSFIWSNSIVSSGNSSTVSTLSAGTYFITITDANGCKQTTSVKIYEPDKVVLSTSPDKTICQSESTTITSSATGGTPPYIFQWGNGPTGTSMTVTPQISTMYSVHVTDSSGCSSLEKYIKITVLLPITAELDVDDESVCEGDPVTFDVSASGGLPPYFYYLNDQLIDIPNLVYPEISELYSLVVSDACGSPVAEDDTMITVYELPQISFSPEIPSGCIPLTVQFNDQSLFDFQQNLWDFGDPTGTVNYSEQRNPAHVYEIPGVFDVTLTVTSKYNCVNSATLEELITAYPLPIADFEPDPTIASIIDPRITFSNLSVNSIACEWDFGDNSPIETECDPVHIYQEPGVYDIRLIALTENQCRDTIFYSDLIITDQYSFYVATAFTPDGNGLNDLFSPVIRGLNEDTYTFSILDRWGMVVFETHKYDVAKNGVINHGWDGSIYGKGTAEVGVYTWLVSYKDKEDVKHTEKGSVTVIR